jgi:hypothetical protein
MLRSLLAFFAFSAAGHAAPVVIYDGSLGTSPTAQGWLLGTVAFTGSANESLITGGVNLDTTSGTIRSGYSIPSPLPLDRTISYNLTFDLQLNAESHSTNDRAGLSLVIIGNDLQGIEIGFWTGDVWAQNLGFTHGEDKPFNTSQRTLYSLGVSGSSYTLSAGGNVLLSGALRDYSASNFPYNVPNFIFVGDDTFSANASSNFFEASVASPEPGTWLAAVCGIIMLSFCRRFATR